MSYSRDWGDRNINILMGQTIKSVEGLQIGSGEVNITTEEGNAYKMYHYQDCCENVDIVDLDGSAEDIIGGLVLSAEEIEGQTPEGYYKEGDYLPESYTWTFYKIETSKGGVFIRWLGTSNGYYSESVSFIDIDVYSKRYN